MAHLIVPDEDLKMLREALCLAQTVLNHTNTSQFADGAGKRIGRLIDQIDLHRPLGNDGKHGDRHTRTCGCEDKPKCVHCGEDVGARDYQGGQDWVHTSGLGRCQKTGVPYGHLAHPKGVPCRADGPNPCLGAF